MADHLRQVEPAARGVRFCTLGEPAADIEAPGPERQGGAPAAPSGAFVGPPRARFLPSVPPPVEAAGEGVGEVELFLSVDGAGEAAVSAALAVLLRARPASSPRLLVEVSDAHATPSAGTPLLSRIATAPVWRTGVAATGGRRRDWVLLLQECRSAYNRTAIAAGGVALELQEQLAALVDRTILVTRPGDDSLRDAHQRLARLREQGVGRCECLWLDAA